MLNEQLPAQFMNYVVSWNAETGKYDKLPCLTNGTVADAHNPQNWTDHATAQAACHFNHERSDLPYGVAFVLTENDPWFFLDLDKCRNADGSWTPEATAIFTNFTGAAGEISVSGTGLHVMGKCDASRLADRKRKWAGWLEFYTEGRFIAFGREGWAPIGGTWNPDLDWTDALGRILPKREVLGELPEGVDPAYTGPENDDELIRKMLLSTGGVGVAFGGKATVAQLWNADPILCQVYPDYGGRSDHFDHSAADAALMAHLAFWTGKDMPRMERLFRQSALMRPKFDRDDYRLKTVQDAARMCNRVYDRPKREPASLPPHEVYMTVPEQIEHFAGCVYVRELHRVWTPDGSLLKPEQFKSYYGGHIFQMNPDGTQPEKNAFVAFTENRTHPFPKVRAAVFDPNQPPGAIVDDTVNTFMPADVVIQQGDITPFLNFMNKILPDTGDQASFIAWMSSVVQNPGVKFQWAPVLQGAEGNGKTFAMNCVAYAIGEHLVHRPKAKNIGEKFNEYVERSLFVIVEEIHMEGRRAMLDDLKDNITNEWLEIRAMQTGGRMARNYAKYGFCTNHYDAVPKTKSDRRYAIYYTAQQSVDDIVRDGMGGNYFPDLYNWARNGGYAAVAHYLMNYDIPAELDPAKLCHRAPNTSTTALAIQKSVGLVEAEILEATEDGTRGFMGGWVSMWAMDQLMRRRNLRVGLNKRAEILEGMGYVKCPAFPGGRAPQTLVWEDGKRPVLFVRPDVDLTDDPLGAYRKAQGYDGMPGVQ